MPASLVYYVSGHGYGHARRSAEVVRALREVAPDVNVYVRTSAPADMFAGLAAGPVKPHEIDSPVVERDPLSIDWHATLAGASDLLRRRRAVVAREADAVREVAPSLIVADVPFLAGEVAAALDVPCAAASNFTWDWIFEAHRGRHPDGAAVVRGVRASHGKMAVLLQLPFGHDTHAFPQVVPVPLVARIPTRDPADVARELDLDPSDRRPRVLIGMRGGVPADVLRRAAAGATDFLFLRLDRGDSPPSGEDPSNLRGIRLAPGLDFSDLLTVSDVVVSKLGYGMIADCIAAGTRLVWPRREGFREDEVTEREAPRYLRMVEMPRGNFQEGDWEPTLARTMALPPPVEQMPLDGAAACARFILGYLA